LVSLAPFVASSAKVSSSDVLDFVLVAGLATDDRHGGSRVGWEEWCGVRGFNLESGAGRECVLLGGRWWLGGVSWGIICTRTYNTHLEYVK
jgi:hypothetical protein